MQSGYTPPLDSPLWRNAWPVSHPVAKQPLLYIVPRPSRLCTLSALMAELFSVRTKKKRQQPVSVLAVDPGHVGNTKCCIFRHQVTLFWSAASCIPSISQQLQNYLDASHPSVQNQLWFPSTRNPVANQTCCMHNLEGVHLLFLLNGGFFMAKGAAPGQCLTGQPYGFWDIESLLNGCAFLSLVFLALQAWCLLHQHGPSL